MPKPLAATLGAVALAMLATSPALAGKIESVTTKFNPNTCEPPQGSQPEGVWRCKGGYRGIAVVMAVGNTPRLYFSYGPRAARELAISETLAAWNGAGERIEWRIAHERGGKRRPFANIMPWTTTVVTDDPRAENGIFRGEVLVVTRLGRGGVCHVGYVDGRQNADADDLARRIADQHARKFRCGKDKPIVLGAKGPGFSDELSR